MTVIKVKEQQQGLKVYLDDGIDIVIPYLNKTFLYKETKEFLDGGGVIEPEFTDSELLLNATNKTKTILMSLCDSKQDDVQRLVLGYKATPMQLERYKDKYERAKSGEFTAELNALIILNHEKYLTAMRSLIDLIEYFRSAVDDLIVAGSLDKANEVITAAESFNETTTLTQIQGLFL